jgi:hypothetical protein
MRLDFNEIQTPDDWELFAREYFKIQGFKIVLDPARGVDGGKDLIVEEQLKGNISNQNKRWLVSCKHYAKTNQAIGCSIESNIMDRVTRHNCDGFIGFYSTLATSDLQKCLEDIKNNKKIDYILYDYRKIEDELVKKNLKNLLGRFFPNYCQKYIKSTNKIFDKLVELKCDKCGKNLLAANDYEGIVIYLSRFPEKWDSLEPEIIEDIKFACKGDCDNSICNLSRANGLTDTWEDLTDMEIPYNFLRTYFSFLKRVHDGEIKFSNDAFEKFMYMNIAIAQKVFRKTTEEERKRIISLAQYGFLI